MFNIKWIGIIKDENIQKYQKVQFYEDDTYYI